MKKGFWAIPKSFAKRRDLSVRAKLVAGVLWSMRNSKSEALPSRSYLAEALGASVTTVDRGIKELVAKAGLKVRRRGFGKSNSYSIPDWQECSEMIPQEASKSTSLEVGKVKTQEASTATTIIDNINKYNTKVDAKKSSTRDVFEYFKNRVRVNILSSKVFYTLTSWSILKV